MIVCILQYSITSSSNLILSNISGCTVHMASGLERYWNDKSDVEKIQNKHAWVYIAAENQAKLQLVKTVIATAHSRHA